MAKMGRPKSENPKLIKLSLRMDEQENNSLEEICRITGDGKMESIRKAIKVYRDFLENGK